MAALSALPLRLGHICISTIDIRISVFLTHSEVPEGQGLVFHS